jgi:S-(hydroxymethyl)glutathione dehydrogenase/alcohol dehydrogenase
MRTDAAILWPGATEWSVQEIELDSPREREVLVRFEACGLCHSDMHLITGDVPMDRPCIGGHEGGGVVEEVGPGVRTLAPGDHVVTTFAPPAEGARCVCRGTPSSATPVLGH